MQKDWQEQVNTKLYLKLTMKKVWERSENVAHDIVNMKKRDVLCVKLMKNTYRKNSKFTTNIT